MKIIHGPIIGGSANLPGGCFPGLTGNNRGMTG